MQLQFVGMRFVGATAAAELAAGLRAGRVTLVRERTHPLDPFAVGAYVDGARRGYVSAQQNRAVARALLRSAANPTFSDIRARPGCISALADFGERRATTSVRPPVLVPVPDPVPVPVPPPVPAWVQHILARRHESV